VGGLHARSPTVDAGTADRRPGARRAAFIAAHVGVLSATLVYGQPSSTGRESPTIARRGNACVDLRRLATARRAVRDSGPSPPSWRRVALSFHATSSPLRGGRGGVAARLLRGGTNGLAYIQLRHDGPDAFHGVALTPSCPVVHAAMGLCGLPGVPAADGRAREVKERYDNASFEPGVRPPPGDGAPGLEPNYGVLTKPAIVFEARPRLLEARRRRTPRHFPRAILPVALRLPTSTAAESGLPRTCRAACSASALRCAHPTTGGRGGRRAGRRGWRCLSRTRRRAGGGRARGERWCLITYTNARYHNAEALDGVLASAQPSGSESWWRGLARPTHRRRFWAAYAARHPGAIRP
jgi:hypothetical protein